MELVVLSKDAALTSRLRSDAIARFSSAAAPTNQIAPRVGEATRIVGATESWWELAVDLGVFAAPVSVACNLIASWILGALKTAPPASSNTASGGPTNTVTLVLRKGTRTAEAEIKTNDLAAVHAAIEAALIHVNTE